LKRRYQPFYCEENAWWLCQHEGLPQAGSRWVAFIANAAKQCPMMQQRAAPPGELVVWDYHVIVITDGDGPEAWDPDSSLGMPVPLLDYLAATFPVLPGDLAGYQPRFRLVAAAELIATFSSDRSHMRRGDGSYTQPPPPWEPPVAPGHITNLARFIDLSDDIAGEVVTLAALRQRFQSSR